MSNLSKDREAFLYYLQMGLFHNSCFKKPSETNWSGLYEESICQAVYGVIYDGISYVNATAPPDLKKKLQTHIFSVCCKNEKILCLQKELEKLLNKNNIPCVILKGSSAGEAYLSPELRVNGDIDVLVHKSDYDRAANILKGEGYQSEEIYSGHHIQFKKNGLEVELHNRLGGLPDGKIGEDIDEYFENAIYEKRIVHINEYEISVLPIYAQGCSLLLHIIQHLQNAGIGFRQLCDYACFKNKYSEYIDSTVYNQLSDRFGIATAAKTIETFCSIYLNASGCKCYKDSEISAAMLLDELFENGNFGFKKAHTAKSKFLVRRYSTKSCDKKHSRLYGIYKASITINPIFSKYKLLQPFAILIFGIRYLFRIITGKRSIKQTYAIIKEAEKREVLLSRLHIFEKRSK